jgi:hypothetical protein
MTTQGMTRYMILSEIPNDGRRSKRLAIVRRGKPELLFAVCGQFGTEDTQWASLVVVLPLCVSRQGYDVLVLWVFSVF